jgi:hypothetical protein
MNARQLVGFEDSLAASLELLQLCQGFRELFV